MRVSLTLILFRFKAAKNNHDTAKIVGSMLILKYAIAMPDIFACIV